MLSSQIPHNVGVDQLTASLLGVPVEACAPDVVKTAWIGWRLRHKTVVPTCMSRPPAPECACCSPSCAPGPAASEWLNQPAATQQWQRGWPQPGGAKQQWGTSLTHMLHGQKHALLLQALNLPAPTCVRSLFSTSRSCASSASRFFSAVVACRSASTSRSKLTTTDCRQVTTQATNQPFCRVSQGRAAHCALSACTAVQSQKQLQQRTLSASLSVSTASFCSSRVFTFFNVASLT